MSRYNVLQQKQINKKKNYEVIKKITRLRIIIEKRDLDFLSYSLNIKYRFHHCTSYNYYIHTD